MTRETVIIMTWSSDLLFISDLIVDHYNLILASSVTFHFRTSHIDSVSAQVGAASLGELVSASPLTVQEVCGFVWAFSGFFSNTGPFKTNMYDYIDYICNITLRGLSPRSHAWLLSCVGSQRWNLQSRSAGSLHADSGNIWEHLGFRCDTQCRSTSATTSSAIVGL